MKSWWKKTGRYLPPLAWGLCLSLLFHTLTLVVQFIAKPRAISPPPKPIEITSLPPQVLEKLLKQSQKPKPPVKSRELEIVETESAGNNEIDPNARFLSDRNQKAEKETRAQLTDDFRNKQGSGAKGAPDKEASLPPTGEPNAPESQESELADQDAIPANPSNQGVKRDWKTLSLKDLGVGGDGGASAATDDRLSGVATGDRTILSTREFRYFSYYHRIKELLRQYWKPNVERQLARIWNRGKTVSEEEMTTQVLVLLDPQGSIQKISKVTSSGFHEIDEAAVEAFQKAGPFPNPPKGMLDDDGLVRIRWDFILKTESAPSIQFRSAGNPRAGP